MIYSSAGIPALFATTTLTLNCVAAIPAAAAQGENVRIFVEDSPEERFKVLKEARKNCENTAEGAEALYWASNRIGSL